MSSISESAVGGSPAYVVCAAAGFTAALLVVPLLPLRISYGYLPPDDALADAAKAISGKPWPEILVLKSDYAIDNHIGWHALLRGVHLLTNWPDEKLDAFFP